MKGSKLIIASLSTALLLTGCGDNPNDPYPNDPGNTNTLYTAFTERPKHLDPAISYSAPEWLITNQVYEPPLQYAYLTRPYTLEPLTATEMPKVREVTEDGKSYTIYTITIKPGMFYQPHPAFAKDPKTGAYLYHDLPLDASYRSLNAFPETGTRELVAEDYVFEIKRIGDPRLNSPIYGLMADKIVGLRELAQAIQAGDKEVDLKVMPISGVTVLDRYQYEIKLYNEYPQFMYWLSMPFFCPMPWEAISFYQQPALQRNNVILDWYPVGTGPFYLTENNPNLKMVLTKNPNYHGEKYPSEGTDADKAEGLLEKAGQTLPFLDQIIFTREQESIPYWAKFLQGYFDQSGVTADNYDQAIKVTSGGSMELTPEIKDKEIKLTQSVAPAMFYLGFNMLDKKIGALTNSGRKLRQAISIAVDTEEFVNIFLNGRGQILHGPLPPGIFGHHDDNAHINPHVYKINKHQQIERRPLKDAKRLLKEAGYPKGIDPKTKKPLVLYLDLPSSANPDAQAQLTWYREQFSKIGIDLVIRATQYNRFQDKMKNGDFEIFFWGWNADYPDPENFLFLLYGKQSRTLFGGENVSNYQSPEFDKLFLKMKLMPNSPERDALIQEMVQVLQKDSPWIWGFTPTDIMLRQAWVDPFKSNPLMRNTMKYMSIQPEKRVKARLAWNQPIRWPLVLGFLLLILLSIPAIYYTWQKLHKPLKLATDKREPNDG